MIIYIDVLIFTNIIINYCILSLSQKFVHFKTNQLRLVLASFTGALFSFIVFIPHINTFLSYALKLIVAIIMCMVGFSYRINRLFIRLIITVFFITIIFCGTIVLVYNNFNLKNMAVINDIVYFQTKPLHLILCSIVIYLIITLINYIFSEHHSNSIVHTTIVHNNNTFDCIGKIDTACSVVEPFSGFPVIIAESSIFANNDIKTTRIVPYKSLGNQGVMKAFKPDKVFIDNKEINKNIYVGIYQSVIDIDFKAIINSEIAR